MPPIDYKKRKRAILEHVADHRLTILEAVSKLFFPPKADDDTADFFGEVNACRYVVQDLVKEGRLISSKEPKDDEQAEDSKTTKQKTPTPKIGKDGKRYTYALGPNSRDIRPGKTTLRRPTGQEGLNKDIQKLYFCCLTETRRHIIRKEDIETLDPDYLLPKKVSKGNEATGTHWPDHCIELADDGSPRCVWQIVFLKEATSRIDPIYLRQKLKTAETRPAFTDVIPGRELYGLALLTDQTFHAIATLQEQIAKHDRALAGLVKVFYAPTADNIDYALEALRNGHEQERS